MRFLCLHGMGTNSDIFAAQLGSILGDLEDIGNEFTFVDGNYECKTTEDIKSVYPGPYLCYYPIPTLELVQEAHNQVFEVIEEEGPFDAVITFSHGAALASSMMLEHAKENPHSELFSLAIFIGASLPFDLDNETGLSVWLSTKSSTGVTRSPSTDEKSTEAALANEFAGELGMEDPPGFPEDPYNCTTKLLARYHPERTVSSSLIHVPTLHIMGAKDPYRGQASLLSQLCESNKRIILEHDDGHCIPRNLPFRRAMKEQIERLMLKAQHCRT